MADEPAHLEELAARESDGVSVSLLWERGTYHVRIAVHDRKSGDNFELEVPATENPMEVFRHPYAYATSAVATNRSSRSSIT